MKVMKLEAKIGRLTKQRDDMERQRDEAQAQLAAWQAAWARLYTLFCEAIDARIRR